MSIRTKSPALLLLPLALGGCVWSAGSDSGHWSDPVTWFTLVLAIANLLLWLTTRNLVSEAKKASEIAKGSADAAARSAWASEKAVKEMRRNATIELRAYLSAVVGPVPLPDGRNQPRKIGVHCRNDGKTPAYGVRSHLSWYFVEPPGPLPPGFAYPELGQGGDGSVGTVGAGQPMIFNFDDPNDYIERAARNEIALFVYGYVTYTHVFSKPDDEPAKTHFCFKYTTDGGMVADGRVVHGFVMCNEYNHAG